MGGNTPAALNSDPSSALNSAALAVKKATADEIGEILAAPLEDQRELFLTYALEREQVVDIAYSEDSISALVDGLDVDEQTRRVVRRAILWIHRDETLHAQYVRGSLLRSRRPRSWAPIIATQVVGMVGGWCSAASPGNRDEAFGLRQLVAQSALRAGALAGQIPGELAAAFRMPGFQAFCEISHVLESAAIEAYDSLLPLLEGEDLATFSRIRADELRHTHVFALFLASFDGNRLRDEVTLDDLIDGLASISPWFLPADHRPGAVADPQAIGSKNSDPKNSDPQDRMASPKSVLPQDTNVHAVDGGRLGDAVDEVLGSLPAMDGSTVAIRANFMLAYDRRDQSNHVAPEIITAIVNRLRELGAADVVVLDSANVYDRYFDGRSVAEVASYIGLEPIGFRIADSAADLVPLEFDRGFGATMASREWVEADVRIILAKLAGDPTEVVHGPLATVAGLAGRIEDEQFYTHRLVDHRTASFMLLDHAPAHYAIVDAWGSVADGPLGVMGCSKPSTQSRMYGGPNLLAVDATVVSDTGVHPSSSEILRRADQWFGSDYSEQRSPSTLGPMKNFRAPHSTWWYRLINATAVPVYGNLSGNGRLFVPQFDENAFPCIDEPGVFVRTVRLVAQRAFGLRPNSASERLDQR